MARPSSAPARLLCNRAITPERCLELTARLREGGVSVPLLLMGYYNPIHHYGLERYAQDCAAAGADGLIVPDLPPEEAEPLREACLSRGLALVFLVAPTTRGSAHRAASPRPRSGFLYVISRLGTTGAGQGPGPELADRLALVRRHARTPVAVGFGISRPEDARSLAPHADGIIVGSAIVERAPRGRTPSAHTWVLCALPWNKDGAKRRIWIHYERLYKAL